MRSFHRGFSIAASSSRRKLILLFTRRIHVISETKSFSSLDILHSPRNAAPSLPIFAKKRKNAIYIIYFEREKKKKITIAPIKIHSPPPSPLFSLNRAIDGFRESVRDRFYNPKVAYCRLYLTETDGQTNREREREKK